MECILKFNYINESYGVWDSRTNKWIDKGLKCGEHLRVCINEKWKETRMEIAYRYNSKYWYLVGLQAINLDGVKAQNKKGEISLNFSSFFS